MEDSELKNLEKQQPCDLGYRGACCCNCKFQLKLMCHPWNKNFGKGNIIEQCGWVCIEPELGEGKSGIYYDRVHGMCENWESRNKKKNNGNLQTKI